MRKRLLYVFLVFIVSAGSVYGQITEEELKVQKAKLQKQNSELKSEIAGLNQELNRNQAESNTSLLYVKNLDAKIRTQNKLIRGLTKEKRYLEDEIYLTQLEINKMNRELVELKKEYEEILVKAYKNKSVENKVLFVLSSKSLSEAYRRIKYLRMYSAYQLGKADEILAKTEGIKKRKEEREKSKLEKEGVLAQQSVIIEDLESEKKTKQAVVEEYKKNAGEISKQIAERQKLQKQIDDEINEIIEEEIRLARIRAEQDKKSWDDAAKLNTIAAFEAYLNEWPTGDYAQSARRNISQLQADMAGWQRARGAHSKAAYQKYLEDFPKGQFASTATLEVSKFEAAEEAARLERERAEREAAAAEVKVEEIKVVEVETPKPVENPMPDPVSEPVYTERLGMAELSSNFSNNRGSLPWPVARGQVVGHFGVGKHPILNIQTNNDGVDIATNKGSTAKAVFDGVVSSIIAIPGGNRTVLVRHGDYYTLYGNLSFVSVKKGDSVRRGQDLGRIYTDSNGDTILNFQVRNGASKQNPETWLSRN